jgi:hypothetical protein
MAKVTIPYGSDGHLSVEIPDRNLTEVLSPNRVDVSSDPEQLIEEALDTPIGSDRIEVPVCIRFHMDISNHPSNVRVTLLDRLTILRTHVDFPDNGHRFRMAERIDNPSDLPRGSRQG